MVFVNQEFVYFNWNGLCLFLGHFLVDIQNFMPKPAYNAYKFVKQVNKGPMFQDWRVTLMVNNDQKKYLDFYTLLKAGGATVLPLNTGRFRTIDSQHLLNNLDFIFTEPALQEDPNFKLFMISRAALKWPIKVLSFYYIVQVIRNPCLKSRSSLTHQFRLDNANVIELLHPSTTTKRKKGSSLRHRQLKKPRASEVVTLDDSDDDDTSPSDIQIIQETLAPVNRKIHRRIKAEPIEPEPQREIVCLDMSSDEESPKIAKSDDWVTIVDSGTDSEHDSDNECQIMSISGPQGLIVRKKSKPIDVICISDEEEEEDDDDEVIVEASTDQPSIIEISDDPQVQVSPPHVVSSSDTVNEVQVVVTINSEMSDQMIITSTTSPQSDSDPDETITTDEDETPSLNPPHGSLDQPMITQELPRDTISQDNEVPCQTVPFSPPLQTMTSNELPCDKINQENVPSETFPSSSSSQPIFEQEAPLKAPALQSTEEISPQIASSIETNTSSSSIDAMPAVVTTATEVRKEDNLQVPKRKEATDIQLRKTTDFPKTSSNRPSTEALPQKAPKQTSKHVSERLPKKAPKPLPTEKPKTLAKQPAKTLQKQLDCQVNLDDTDTLKQVIGTLLRRQKDHNDCLEFENIRQKTIRYDAKGDMTTAKAVSKQAMQMDVFSDSTSFSMLKSEEIENDAVFLVMLRITGFVNLHTYPRAKSMNYLLVNLILRPKPKPNLDPELASELAFELFTRVLHQHAPMSSIARKYYLSIFRWCHDEDYRQTFEGDLSFWKFFCDIWSDYFSGASSGQPLLALQIILTCLQRDFEYWLKHGHGAKLVESKPMIFYLFVKDTNIEIHLQEFLQQFDTQIYSDPKVWKLYWRFIAMLGMMVSVRDRDVKLTFLHRREALKYKIAHCLSLSFAKVQLDPRKEYTHLSLLRPSWLSHLVTSNLLLLRSSNTTSNGGGASSNSSGSHDDNELPRRDFQFEILVRKKTLNYFKVSENAEKQHHLFRASIALDKFLTTFYPQTIHLSWFMAQTQRQSQNPCRWMKHMKSKPMDGEVIKWDSHIHDKLSSLLEKLTIINKVHKDRGNPTQTGDDVSELTVFSNKLLFLAKEW